MGELLMVWVAVSAAGILGIMWALYLIWWWPKKVEKYLRQQGIKGPPYSFFYGNHKDSLSMLKKALSKPMNLSHNIVPRILPFNLQIAQNYGKMSVTWFGATPRVIIMDPELVRDVLSNKFGHFAKPKRNPLLTLLVTGLLSYDGEKWAKHRRILNPAFHQEKLKRMLPAFYTGCNELVSRWNKLVEPNGSYELDVWPELQNLTGDFISRTAFGSSYEEGRLIFQLLNEQAMLALHVFQTIYIPGIRFLPTKRNNRMKQIDRELRALLRGIINKRELAIKIGEANNNDLLGLLMESNIKEIREHGDSKMVGMSTEEVIEECKLFYLAGQETTSVLLVWTMIVLSMHPEWQTQARDEVLQVFGEKKPDFDGLNHLKIVTMILHEVLRLYPPVVMLTRRTYKEMKLGEISLPPEVQIQMPIALIHHDHELWGEDADEFNPDRFSEGISKATKNQVSFFPFSWGPRTCIGQNFALIEAKVALSMILRHFSFELSATYAHAPCTVVTLQPQHGAQIILHRL